MAPPAWLGLALGYAVYLTVVAWSGRRFARARGAALAVLIASLGLAIAWSSIASKATSLAMVAWVAVPGLLLLATYRASGAFFIRPNLALERWLLDVDHAALIRTGIFRTYHSARAMRWMMELLYLLVYVMVPGGAAVLALASRGDWLPRYWAVVFAAELACYAMLPWLQTRPPRLIGDASRGEPDDALRQLNLAVLEHGSIQVNTLPSAHAAGACALALVMVEALPAIGSVFLAIAIGITLATVLGRYHYLADAVLGVLVGAAAWLAVR